MGAAATPVARLESALAHAILPFDWYSNYCAHVDAGVANSATVQRYVGNPIRANQPLTREKVKRDTQRVLRVSKNRLPTVQLVASVRVYESTPGTTLGVGLYSPHLWISLWIGV